MPRSPFAMLRSLWFDISILITVSSSLCVKFFASAAKCYYPNGSPVLSGEYQPCVSISSSSSSSMVDSMCCATNRTAGISAFHKDYCLSNGLCHNPCSIDNRCNDLPGHFWRETCTDATWNSPFCLKGICANDDGTGSSNNNVPLSQCAVDGHWCCGDMTSEECCGMDSRFYLEPNIGAGSSTSTVLTKSASSTTTTQSAISQSVFNLDFTSISSSSISSSASPAKFFPSTSPAKFLPPSRFQAGKSVGIGVGSSIGVLGIGIVVIWLILRQRQNRRRRANEQNHDQRPMEETNAVPYRGRALYEWHPAELGHQTRLAMPEIDGVNAHEMEGRMLT